MWIGALPQPRGPAPFLSGAPHPPTPGREGGGLLKEDLWRIEVVGVVSSWSWC
jgi:hypothetical protein